MDPLEISYDSINAVPEPFRGLYEEKDGKAVLTRINGMKTIADVNNVSEALRKERSDHAAVREMLKPWNSLGKKPDEIQAQLDRIAELEAAAAGKIDETKLTSMVEARLGAKTAPLERQLREATELNNTILAERDNFRNQLYTRDLNDNVRSIATEMKVISTAVPDVELFVQMATERQEDGTYVTKSGIPGVTAGLTIKELMKDMQKLRPHWWPASQGGGAGGNGGGGGGDNPWSAANWNLTAQGAYVREHGMAKAQEAAKAAGSAIGATRPTVKK